MNINKHILTVKYEYFYIFEFTVNGIFKRIAVLFLFKKIAYNVIKIRGILGSVNIAL